MMVDSATHAPRARPPQARQQLYAEGEHAEIQAHLAEKMQEMNKQKQQENDYESFLAVLKKNRKKLAIYPARREPAELLRAEFEGLLGKLGPLREKIREMDELIDATVYRLYGLTEEEIGIVEGKV
jgi:hypothetical protein